MKKSTNTTSKKILNSGDCPTRKDCRSDMNEGNGLIKLQNGSFNHVTSILFIHGKEIKPTNIVSTIEDVNKYLAKHPSEGLIDQNDDLFLVAKLDDKGREYEGEAQEQERLHFEQSNRDVSPDQLAGEQFDDKLAMYRNEY